MIPSELEPRSDSAERADFAEGDRGDFSGDVEDRPGDSRASRPLPGNRSENVLIFSIFTKTITKSAECARVSELDQSCHSPASGARTGPFWCPEQLPRTGRNSGGLSDLDRLAVPSGVSIDHDSLTINPSLFLQPYGFEVSHRLDGKVAIITGVSDRGIGGAIAERLADDGAAVAILWMERPSRLIQSRPT